MHRSIPKPHLLVRHGGPDQPGVSSQSLAPGWWDLHESGVTESDVTESGGTEFRINRNGHEGEHLVTAADDSVADHRAADHTAPLPAQRWFTGRRAVLARILAWMHAGVPGAFVVTGSPGSGKSAVVRRIVALSEPAQRRALIEDAPLGPADPDPGIGAIDAAVDLRGMTAHDVATVLADRLELPAPLTCWQLIEAVAEMPYPPVLVFDGLDEAVPEQATEIVTDLLVPLGVLANVLLATRHQEFGWHQPPSGPQGAAQLEELFGGRATVVDLDAEPDTQRDIERYVARRLRSAGQAALARRVARTLARRAALQQGGFLYACTVLSQIICGVVDAHADGWYRQLAPTTAAALEQDLARRTRVRDGVELPDAARDLLRALAWGMGRGMPGRDVWPAAAAALSPGGTEYHSADLDWVLEHYGYYLVVDEQAVVDEQDGVDEQAVVDEQDGEPVYRLAHREFVEHFLACSPDVRGRSAAQALAEALVALAQKQTGQDGAAEPDSPYLLRHLARHATHAGPAGVTALRGMADTDPGVYLPGLAVALRQFAAHLLTVGGRMAALSATQHAVETYQALVTVNSDTYLPGLAATLGSLAAQHAELRRPEIALGLAQQAADIHVRLTEASPEIYFIHLVASLKDLTGYLAALDRISAAVDVYTGCIQTFVGSPVARDALIIERAVFRIVHGDAPGGHRELVTLLTLDDGETPDAVVLAARNALREQRSRDGAAVDRAWRAVTGAEPPDWLSLTAAQMELVTEWITAPNWAESKEFCAAHTGELLDHPATVVLDELALVAAARVELHRHLLDGVLQHGLETAFRPLLLRDLLTDWMALTYWPDSQSFAEEHAAELFTVEAEIALVHLGNPLGTLVHLALIRLGRRDGVGVAYACVTDRQVAADRMRRALADVDPDPIAELAALEGQVFGEQFTAAAHLFVAGLLMGEAVTDATRLAELAEQADPADQQRVTAEIADLITRVPDRAARFGVLPEILLRKPPPERPSASCRIPRRSPGGR